MLMQLIPIVTVKTVVAVIFVKAYTDQHDPLQYCKVSCSRISHCKHIPLFSLRINLQLFRFFLFLTIFLSMFFFFTTKTYIDISDSK